MPDLILPNKPLVEAIFELKWHLQEENGASYDPHYKLLVGQVYEKIKNSYPYHQTLPQASIPDEMAAYVVQHRFRIKKDNWPLIQIGPGVITLNDTESYTWPSFKERIIDLLETIYNLYPSNDVNFEPENLLLRYIDAVNFDFENDDILHFLDNMLKTKINIHDRLFDDTGVEKSPYGIDLKFSFPSTKPNGAITIRFARGKRNNVDALIWETQVQSILGDVPKEKEEIIKWVEDAHTLTHDWFFKLIDGELRKRFE